MANPDDTLDSNETIDASDLDSIDALLDEAEFETTQEEAPEAELDDFDASDLPDTDVSEADSAESLLDDLEDDLGGMDDLEDFSETAEAIESLEPEPVIEPEPEPELEPELIPEPPVEKPAPSESEEFLQKRMVSNQAPKATNELTVAEMDALKKLIIIFSSVLIVLALIGIGMGIWAALAAGSGLDEESTKMLEDIKAGTEQNTLHDIQGEKSLKGLEKKLDALSFQLEQINGDIVDITMNKKAEPLALNLAAEVKQDHSQHAPAAHQEHGYDNHAPAGHQEHGQTQHQKLAPVVEATHAPVAPAAPIVAKADPEMKHKLDKVSSQIVTTQKRIAEVNRRIKDMQYQYKLLMKSMKKVEQNAIQQALEAKKKAKMAMPEEETEQEKQPEKTYQFSVPEKGYYW